MKEGNNLSLSFDFICELSFNEVLDIRNSSAVTYMREKEFNVSIRIILKYETRLVFSMTNALKLFF